MDKSEIADIFEEIAVLLELKGENPFKARAYVNGARVLGNYEGDLGQLVAEDRLEDLPGIGEALHQKIVELVTDERILARHRHARRLKRQRARADLL